jgi:ABC-2 type transport system permease protein
MQHLGHDQESVLICFAFVIVGVPDVVAFLNAYAPAFVAEAATSISFLDHFTSIQRGVFDLTDAVFFASLAVGWLVFCAIVLDVKKAS